MPAALQKPAGKNPTVRWSGLLPVWDLSRRLGARRGGAFGIPRPPPYPGLSATSQRCRGRTAMPRT